MADVQPLRALHYDPAVVGALDAVVAPPYDVIDPAQRRELAARSPYNVVRIDLPEAEDEGGDAYATAAQLLERWQAGPREDRLKLTRATKANLSPIFSLYSDPVGSAWGAVEPATGQPPFGE